jgi:hypothetical protein
VNPPSDRPPILRFLLLFAALLALALGLAVCASAADEGPAGDTPQRRSASEPASAGAAVQLAVSH